MAEATETTYEAIRSGSARRVVARDGLVVSGPGALEWLQGQVSQDLAHLGQGAGAGDVNASVETLVLSPQGKIDSLCRVTTLGADRYLLDVRAGFGEALQERLRRFKLRVKADLEPLDGLSLMQVRGPRTPAPAELSSSLGPTVMAVVEVDWPGWSGRDVLFRPASQHEQPEPALDSSGGDDEAFEAVRIEAGVPELGLELTERTIPQEAGALVARAVSFTKGCYTGQELVARIDARGGNTPRRLFGLVIDEVSEAGAGSPAPAPGDEILVGGAKVGELTSVAWSSGMRAHVALAYIKRGTDTSGETHVTTAAGAAKASIRSLPLSGG
ncbi:MAG: YgfZ/GcvT domain-containing protein [Acidimicrobiales bacterium]